MFTFLQPQHVKGCLRTVEAESEATRTEFRSSACFSSEERPVARALARKSRLFAMSGLLATARGATLFRQIEIDAGDVRTAESTEKPSTGSNIAQHQPEQFHPEEIEIR